jgi:hypothetical protein
MLNIIHLVSAGSFCGLDGRNAASAAERRRTGQSGERIGGKAAIHREEGTTCQQMKHMVLLRSLSSLLLMATIHGCSPQPIQVTGSPCSTLHSTVQSKSSVELALLFGTDAIKAAMDAIKRQIATLESTPTAELTSLGTDVAVHTAQASGKNLMPQDRTAMEIYLQDEMVPAIRQNPACFTGSSSSKSYFGVERIVIAPGQAPEIVITNSGQAEARAEMFIRQFVNGSERSRSQRSLTLGPGLSRSVFTESAPLPISEVLDGKATLMIAVSISYHPEPNAKRVELKEAWQYDPSYNRFILVPMK